MSRSNADLLALKAELTTDPKTLGLTLLAADDEANSVKLNTVMPTLLIDREAIPSIEIGVQIDRDEWAALSASDRQLLQVWSDAGSINPKAGGEVREGLLQMFGPTSETRANLLAILSEPSSRITQLYKLKTLSFGGAVSPSDIADARNAV